MKEKEFICAACGKVSKGLPWRKYCPACSATAKGKSLTKQRRIQNRKENMKQIKQIAALAYINGLSYGQAVAKGVIENGKEERSPEGKQG